MLVDPSMRTQVEALEALAHWKAVFAAQVTAKAKEIARAADGSGLVTLDHYRQAAAFALQVLKTSVEEAHSGDDRREAA